MNTTELSKAIAEKLEVYVKDPSKRCVKISGFNSICRYSSESLNKVGDGCLVGAFLTPADRIKADKFFADKQNSSVRALSKHKEEMGVTVPKIIGDNLGLFAQLQELHDEEENWEENSISTVGKQRLENLIVVYSLDREVFKNILDN